MSEQEKNLEQLQQEESLQESLSGEDFSLEDIMKEFSDDVRESAQPEEAGPESVPEAELEQTAPEVTSDTVRMELPVKETTGRNMEDTVRLGDTVRLAPEKQSRESAVKMQETTVLSGSEPGYAPQKPIAFQPRSRVRELKRKLVAGPERRYYEINEQGFGKLQIAIFLNLLVVLLSAGATALYAMGFVQPGRMKLMVFGQCFAMLVSALLGSYQLLEGLSDMFRGRFSLNSLLVFTLAACGVDALLCLKQLRVPCCAAFCLQVTMSLWGAYHCRTTEMGMMDTLRKASHLDGIVKVPDYHDGCAGLLRSEGQVEDFMDRYEERSGPEKVMSVYALMALAAGIGIGIAAGVLHKDISFGIQVLSVSLLAAVPVTSFVALSRPMALLERRLHKAGTVICGWNGVKAMCRRALFPLKYEDLFPAGACKLNGVKFYGSRDPDQVVDYATALVNASGSGLAPLFEQLLASRNGRHYTVRGLRAYGDGGIGGEVCQEPVLVGTLPFLKEMGVEIPEGTSVNQAVYVAIDGELSGVFAMTYNKVRSSAVGLRVLCSYRGLRPVMTTGDFMLTEEFLRSRFFVNTRRICFPERAVRVELAKKEAQNDEPALALVTTGGLMPFAYAVAGARAVRTASIIGVVMHLLGGILGLAIMLILAILGEGDLLTPSNLFLYELVWIIPGLLVTEWTRSI